MKLEDALAGDMQREKRPAKRTYSESKAHWLDAVQKAKVTEDPWSQYNIENEKTERAVRFRYNALQKKWIMDNVQVKIQKESFGQGAMRKCFRMKKLSKIVHQHDWRYATNIVAKLYIADVLPKVYFDDVKLQMDAKLWAEEYNRHDPPKKVDIIQVGCLKLIDREDTPMYHIEHFVEGDYVKYNSNSGFVLHQDKVIRDTPQAFSHFTFERSGHQMIVVDVQGVGDLYTDPQIHTARGCEYGDGNLGTKGMALFFASHQCLKICHELDLEAFDLSEEASVRVNSVSSASSTSTEVKKPHHHSEGHNKVEPAFDLVDKIRSCSSSASDSCPTTPDGWPMEEVFYADAPQRSRMCSEFSDSGFNSEEDGCSLLAYFKEHERKCSNVKEIAKVNNAGMHLRLKALSEFEEQQSSILGQIHYDLAVYNYIGRFTDSEADYESVLYHLKKAGSCDNLQANKILAYKYLQLDTDEFQELRVEEDYDQGMDFLLEAASRGDRDCLIRCAKAFETGEQLGTSREKSFEEALKWYEAALDNTQEVQSDFNYFPLHQIHARMAEIWRTGGFGVEKDVSYAGELYSSAADAAIACGKGKMANKYFILAEEAWAEVED